MLLESAESITITLHTITVIACPLHVLGCYCVLFKTPKELSSVKWTMFNLHFWCMVLDWCITIFCVPFLLFPAIAGIPYGVLATVFHVPTIFLTYLNITAIFMVGAAIVSIFENRYYQLYGQRSWWRYFRKPFLVANYILCLSFLSPTMLHLPDETRALEIVLETIPDLPLETRKGAIFVFCNEPALLIIPFYTTALIEITAALLFVKLILRNMKLSSASSCLSQKTINIQRRFLGALYAQASLINLCSHGEELQVAAFSLSLVTPAIYPLVSYFLNYYNQGANNIAMTTVALHGISATVIMLWAHRPYRDVCIGTVQDVKAQLAWIIKPLGSRDLAPSRITISVIL